MSDTRPTSLLQQTQPAPVNTSVIEPATVPPRSQAELAPVLQTTPQTYTQASTTAESPVQIFTLANSLQQTEVPAAPAIKEPAQQTAQPLPSPVEVATVPLPNSRWLILMNIIMLGLFLFHGLRGLISSVRFIYIEFPLFEQLTFEHGLPQEHLFQLMIKMSIILAVTGVNLLFAVHLVTFDTISEKKSRFFFSVLLFILSFILTQYAQGINYLS